MYPEEYNYIVKPATFVLDRRIILCSLLASVYSVILSRACVPTLFTSKEIIKKSTLHRNIAHNYRPVTLNDIRTKVVDALIVPDTDLFDTQF